MRSAGYQAPASSRPASGSGSALPGSALPGCTASSRASSAALGVSAGDELAPFVAIDSTLEEAVAEQKDNERAVLVAIGAVLSVRASFHALRVPKEVQEAAAGQASSHERDEDEPYTD